jgi:cytidylate kinase
LQQIIARDDEDAQKLQNGIDAAIKKNVLPGDLTPPTYEPVDVLGKTADQVADEIIAKLPKEGGCVMILVGLSGTGKGTTVNKLKSRIPGATAWSNGNCFRSLTLLAVTACEQEGKEFDATCLTPENLAKWAGMLEFGQFDGKFDIRINGLGIDKRVSEIACTLLQEPKVAKNIPTVAQETQGEVVKFAGDAVKKMGDAGTVVLLEGREQTLNFISSPHRFCLTMSDTSVLGARRGAQRIAAAAAKNFKDVGRIFKPM